MHVSIPAVSSSSGVKIISEDTTYTIKASDGNFATLAEAFDYLQDTWINKDATVTLEIDDGTYNWSNLTINHPHGSRIVIKGKNTYQKLLNGIQSTSGYAGSWSFVLNLSDIGGISVGDYVIVKQPTGGSYPYHVAGCHQVSNVDQINSRITVTSIHRNAIPPSGTVAATVYVIKSIVTGMGLTINSQLGAINNLVLAGGSGTGIWVADGGVVYGADSLGVSGFGRGIYIGRGSLIYSLLSISGGVGIHCTGSGELFCANSGNYLYVSGAPSVGIRVERSGSIRTGFGAASQTLLTGNAVGLEVSSSGIAKIMGLISSGNTSHGIDCHTNGFVDHSSSTGEVTNNGGYGYSATIGGIIQKNALINDAENALGASYPVYNTLSADGSYISMV